MAETIANVALTGNDMKVYHQENIQRLEAIDLNRISGAEFEDSMFSIFLEAIQTVTGKTDQIVIAGFKLLSQTVNDFQLGPGIVVSAAGVFKFPGAILTPNANGLWGKYEFSLTEAVGEDKLKQFFNITTKNFTPAVGPSRKIFTFNLREKYEDIASEPAITNGFYPLIQYKRATPGGDLTEVSFITEILNSGSGLNGLTIEDGTISNDELNSDIKIGSLASLLAAFTGIDGDSITNALNFVYTHANTNTVNIGSLASLVAGYSGGDRSSIVNALNFIYNYTYGVDVRVGSLASLVGGISGSGRDSIVSALNFIYNMIEAKYTIRSLPGGGFEDVSLRFRVQGNYMWWDKNSDGNFRPFA